MRRREDGLWRPVAGALIVVVALGAAGAAQRAADVESEQARSYMGTWVLAMSNPAGATETVKVWDNAGTVAASIQAGRFPAIQASTITLDGDLLILTLRRFENGQPIWAVVALSVDGDTMHIAQMLQRSETIKRGSGKKRAD